VKASYFDPWHGQWNCVPAGFTVQPWWVQIAENATTSPAVFCDTITGAPSFFAEAQPPTGTSASLMIPAGAAALDEAALDEPESEADALAAPPAPAGWDCAAFVSSELEPELPQAASARLPAPMAPLARTERREISGMDEPICGVWEKAAYMGSTEPDQDGFNPSKSAEKAHSFAPAVRRDANYALLGAASRAAGRPLPTTRSTRAEKTRPITVQTIIWAITE
jgi:hypothetical protein